MKEFRKDKNCTEHYTSLGDLGKAFGCKPITKRTKDQNKLEIQKNKFLGVCPYCKEQPSYIGGNVIACKNEKCTGKKVEKENEDGTKLVMYYPYIKLLDKRGEDIAQNIFDVD